MLAFGAVTGWLTAEIMALHDTRRALALARADHIDKLYAIKLRNRDLLTELTLARLLQANFAVMFQGGCASLAA